MSARIRCNCQSCTIRGLVGPAVVITLGILLLLSESQGGRYYFENTWPVLLVVIGLFHLASSFASREGHVDILATTPMGQPPASSAPPANPPQAPYSSQGQ